jgi:sec-independent protein translocase protein TatC
MPPDEDYLTEVKPFLDHLEDLRRTLIRCAAALGAGVAVCLPFAPRIMDLLMRPLFAVVAEPEEFLWSMDVTGAVSLTLRIAGWGGLLLSLPLLLWFVGQFVFPGLTRLERHAIAQSGGTAAALFALGVAAGYFVTLPVALDLMFRWHGWLGLEPRWLAGRYIAFAIQILIAFGLAFEMPVAVMILGRMGFLTSRQLRDKRRHVIVGLLVVAMLLTPPDPMTQLLMAVPLTGLYELCIWILWRSERRARR